jgi:hypothetical protein
MKSPPVQYTDDNAHRMVEDYIADTKSCPEPVKKAVAEEKKP